MGGVNAGTGVTQIRGVVAYPSGAAGTAPTITSDGGGATATVNVPAPTTPVTTVTATGDPNIAFSISGGTNAALFQIDATSGVLSFRSASSAGSYQVIVQATNFWGVDNQTITVVVGNVPVITSNGGGPTATIPVTAPATAVTTVTATGTATITFTKSGADAALFSIGASSGVLAFLAPSVAGTYHVTVTATNTWGHDDQALTVVVS